MDKKSVVRGKASIHAIILKILEVHKKPLTIKEITDLVLKQKTISGKYPYQTVNSVLQRSKYLKRVGKATFQLID